MRRHVVLMALAGCFAAAGSTPAGFDAQCGKQLWVTYRSFNKELERTGQLLMAVQYHTGAGVAKWHMHEA